MLTDKPAIPDGVISRAVRKGLVLRKQLLADGSPEHEADRIVGHALKAAWEHSTKRTSEADTVGHYLCGKCFDSGWVVTQPSYMERKRLTRMYGENPPHQDYMQKCDPCFWLDREREKRRNNGGDSDGIASAGRIKRRSSGFSRFQP